MNKNAPTLSSIRFLVASLFVLTALSYVIIFLNLNTQRIESSKRLFHEVVYQLSTHIDNNDFNLKAILANHTDFNRISYRVMVLTPSGQPFVHSHRREDQLNQSLFTLPHWTHPVKKTEYYHVDQKELLGWAALPLDYEVYIQIIHPPLPINWSNPIYWLPILTALCLLIWGLYLNLAYKLAWRYIIDYTQTFPTRLNEPYQPLKVEDLAVSQEFQRLTNSLNRINQQLHHQYRRSQTLKKRLHRISDFAPLPMLMINRNGQVSYFNRRFEQLFMAVFQEDFSYFVTDFLTGKDKNTQQILTKLSELRIPRTLNVSSLQDNADYLLHLTPWSGKLGQVQGFCAQLTDVSQFTNALKSIDIKIHQQADRLVEFDKLWSVLGHELRTPLSGMIGLLDLMDTDNFNQDQLETYTTLERTGHTMLTMLNDMLDMAKMNAGKLQLMVERTDILTMCHQVTDLMASNARNQNIELLVYFEPQCPRYLDTDAGRIRQALMNLLGNAIKFTQVGYVALLVSILKGDSQELHRIAHDSRHISQQKIQSDWICFRIKDTGIGICDTDKSKLFSHFNQANESISRQFGGTGLGLAISNNFAQLLGGFIHVDSSLGQGSEFSLCLPLEQVTYQPVYHFNSDLNHLCLIAFNSQTFSTSALHSIADYLNFACLAYTGIPENELNKITKINFTKLTVIVLIEEELYQSEAVELLFDVPIIKEAPKILLSMRPEGTIPLPRKEQYDAFLTKPLVINHLVKQLVNLSSDTWDLSNSKPGSISNAQQSYNAFMQQWQHTQQSPNSFTRSIPSLQNALLYPANHLLTPPPNLPIFTPLPEPLQPADIGALILVAEDNIINQKVACKVLDKLGYRSITADNGQQVLEILESHSEDIHLILMDCRMPILNGFETTERIRATQNSIPIIALTANDTDTDREECREAGMNGFLSKPIKKEALAAALNKFMVS